MRRIVAVALTTGALVAGLGAVATPAQAATTKKWETIDAFPHTRAWGQATKTSSKFTWKGSLKDGRKDGWTACVRFKAVEGDRYQTVRYIIVTGGGTAYDGPGTVSISGSSSYNGKLYVQECRRSKKTGKYQYADKKWRKIF
ncbi:hypothetical protein [Thermomonospora cellulosilytica]|uniref:Secreted protein n=1 Tax=Thermomonospora cellulosilytica TaxID=1411118 RepID=A0A7W3MU54_9ACTN|nr:hypothetical protein [Thermomonospora cellulosilytica]MBA9001908.1 hypothetical protein [Thermomonospora cellulosilytica]